MNSDFSVSRIKMVDGQIRTTDVTQPALLDAMLAVPREMFVPEGRRALAYIDEDLEVAAGRYLMEPSPFAKLVQLAQIGKNDRVLEVGCGTGYGAAVMSRLGASVTALECDPMLADAARGSLAQLGAGNVSVVVGPLEKGWSDHAPFDVIVVEGSVDALPPTLPDQLAEEGRLVVVEGRGNAGVARLYLKSGGTVAGRRGFNAAVKSLPGFDRALQFEF